MKTVGNGYDRAFALAAYNAFSAFHYCKRVGMRQTGKNKWSIDVQMHPYWGDWVDLAFIYGFIAGYYGKSLNNLTFFESK